MPTETAVFMLVILAIAGLGYAMPALTRTDIFFAVSTAREFRATSDARRITLRYRVILLCATVAAIAALFATTFAPAGVLVSAVGYLWAIVDAHRRTLRFAVPAGSVREADLSQPREELPGGPALALAPLVSLALLGLWAYRHWDRLPARFPLDWGFKGPDRWVATSTTTVVGLLAVYAMASMLPAGAAWGIIEWSRRISTSRGGSASERWFRRRIAQMLIVIGILVTLPAWFALLKPPAIIMGIWSVVFAVLVVAFTASLLRAGQGGSRRAGPAAAAGGDRTPDACWKWGLIYVNQADPSILVEKRFGVGYTLNFGNRWTWVLLAFVLAPVAVGALLLR